MAQFSEQDLILLNTYLDGRLEPSERTALETRLAQDAGLRDELETLRDTIGLLKMAERVHVPRSFTLDPAVYGQPARRSVWDRLGLTSIPGWALGAASLAAVMLCAGALIGSSLFSGSATSVAMNAAPMAAAQATEAPTEAAAEAAVAAPPTQAPAATEAPAAATEAATEAPTLSMFAAIAPTEATAGKSAPIAPPTAGMMTPTGEGVPSGMGGGPAFPQPQPTLNAGGVAQDSQQSRAGDQTGVPSNLTVPATPAPYSTIEIVEADPLAHLKPGGWAVLLAGSGVLILLVLGVTVVMRRRR